MSDSSARAVRRSPGSAADREFTMSAQEFMRLRKLVFELTGISLNEAKRDLVYSRFTKRLRALGLDSFGEYCRRIEEHEIDEVEEFANAITTNLTSFFRERHHFEFLANEAVPELRERNARRLRVWSAGCSTGEEPYSIAMTLLESWPGVEQLDAKLLATDLDSSVVRKAAAGVYDKQRVSAVDAGYARRWFETVPASAKQLRVNAKLRGLLSFRQLNLMHEWPMRGPFEIIFCRNTVIYFDKPTQQVLFERFANLQNVGDYLFIGHSENLNRVTTRYEPVGQTVYRKVN